MHGDRQSVTQTRIGLHRIGIVVLNDALRAADGIEAAEREAIVDFVMERLAAYNCIPDAETVADRNVVWREHLRRRGEDIRALFDPVEVVVRGDPGLDYACLDELLRAALGRHELRPILRIEPADGDASEPRLLIGGDLVFEGRFTQCAIEHAIRKTLSHW